MVRRDNWTLYKANDRRNFLAADRFNYDVLNHTDLSRDNGSSGDIDLAHVNWGNYDLVVIDESHNFRNKSSHNDRETRYDRLMRRIIKKGGWTDTDENNQANRDNAERAYSLIMREKEKLLSFETRLKFIFSHSALKEGWDNPNVFQICALREMGTERERRQTIGRGLRLCVNQDGERLRGFDVNTLTVIATEGVEQFAENLQKEIEKETGIEFGIVAKDQFAPIAVVDAAGRHDRGGVLAFSLSGGSPRYNLGAIENAKLAKWIYPDWTVRVYVDDFTPEATIDALRAAASDVVRAPQWPNWQGGMFWRLLTIDDPGFVRWGIRDADSRPTYRERQSVESWLDSGLPLHTTRDHPGHGHPVTLCDFDGHRASIHDMAGQIDSWRSNHGDEYGSDESLIAECLWPTIRDKTMVHTEFGNRHGHGGVIQPFPARRAEGLRFIGERIYEDNHPNGDDRDCYVAARLAATAG